jgi:hypothetical protein
LVLSLEGVAEGAQFVEQTAQRPNIAFFVVRLFLAELGREVKRSPNHSLGKLVASQNFGYPQIAYLNLLILVHKDVQSLDIPMQYLILMDVLKTQTYLDEESPNFVLLQGPLILQLEVVVEIAIVAVLHDDVEGVVLDEGLLVAHDEGVHQLTHNRCFVYSLDAGRGTLLRAFSFRRVRLICFSTQISLVDLFIAL